MFYISSRGSTANHWLAKTLSKHPQIVCFRSTRGFPPFDPSSTSHTELSVDLFFDGLLECSSATFHEKIFGSIHGYHGLIAKTACEKKGGLFSYLIRHPISRIHSAYIYHLIKDIYKPGGIEMSADSAHERVCLIFSKELSPFKNAPILRKKSWPQRLNKYFYKICQVMLDSLFPIQRAKIISKIRIIQKSFVDRVTSPLQKIQFARKNTENVVNSPNASDLVLNEKRLIRNLFIKLCDDFMRADNSLYDGCSQHAGIVMEEMVVSSQYFKNHLWERIAPNVQITDNYLTSVFSESRFNIHRQNPMTPEQVWLSWPDSMKNIFRNYFEKYNLACICDAFGYDRTFL